MSAVTRLTRLAARVVALGAVVGLAACGTSDPAPAGADTRTVQHAMGATQITGKPLRIVTLDDTFTSAAMALEGQVVGYTTTDGSGQQLPDYLGADRQNFGGQAKWVGTLSQPNLEEIVKLKPDLILSAKVRHEQLYDQLSRIAPTVFSETTGASWKENLRLAGQAMGKEPLADDKLRAYEQRAKAVGDNIRAAAGHNPQISLVRFAGKPTVRLYTQNSFPGIVQSDTGLARPQEQPPAPGIAVELSQERIRELDAEHIFLTAYSDPAGNATKAREAFQANPLWGQLKGQQHEVNDNTWMMAVGLHGANAILDDLATTFKVDPAH